jgi:hypothetical protein
VHKDDVYESLFDDCDPELDTLTQMALELLSHSILLILDRQAKDQQNNWSPSKIEEASLPHFCSFSIKIDK